MKKGFQGLKRVLSLIMVFAMIISFMPPATARAANGVSGGNLYFDNSVTGWTDEYIYFVIGHNSYSALYRMSKVDDTGNLYKTTITQWDGSTYYAIIGPSTSWGNGNWGPSNLTNASHYTAAYTDNYGLNSGRNYVFMPADSVNGTNLTINWYGTTPYGVSVADTENGTVKTSKTVEEKGNDVTLTVTPDAGYELDELTVMNGDIPVTVTNNSFKMPDGNVTVSATFKKISYGVTFNGTNVTSSKGENSTATHGEKYEATLTAAEGYTLPETVTVTVGGTAIDTFTFAEGVLTIPAASVTGNITITAEGVEEETGYTVYFINSANWDKVAAYAWTGSGSGWPGILMTKTGETVNGFDVYEVTFDTAHENVIFNNNGNGSQTPDLKLQAGQYYYLKDNK